MALISRSISRIRVLGCSNAGRGKSILHLSIGLFWLRGNLFRRSLFRKSQISASERCAVVPGDFPFRIHVPVLIEGSPRSLTAWNFSSNKSRDSDCILLQGKRDSSKKESFRLKGRVINISVEKLKALIEQISGSSCDETIPCWQTVVDRGVNRPKRVIA